MKRELSSLTNCVNNFRTKKVVVIGDLLLDNYVFGFAKRVNPERPGYPLLTVQREEFRLGGAANVAVNLASLGCDVTLICPVGADKYRYIIRKLCIKRKVKLRSFVHGQTIIKQRWIEMTHNDYFGRADFGENTLMPISKKDQDIIIEWLSQEDPDGIILSDYDKTVFKTDVAQSIINWAKQKDRSVFVDPRPANLKSFIGATLICPNLREAKEILGLSEEKTFREIARSLKDITKTKYSVVTCGADGIVVDDGNFYHIPAKTREVVDVTGAGDTAIATLALALLSGAEIKEAAYIANQAAAVVCEKIGTATVTQKRLLNEILRSSKN